METEYVKKRLESILYPLKATWPHCIKADLQEFLEELNEAAAREESDRLQEVYY
jgi:hypothetical protein